MNEKSPYLSPLEGAQLREGAPSFKRPSREEVSAFPARARERIENILEEKEKGGIAFPSQEIADSHFLICGATGYGLGASLAAYLARHLKSGSLTIVSRDLKNSLNFETGRVLASIASENSVPFDWINTGVSLEGESFEALAKVLKDKKAKEVIYISAVAYAFSGVLPGYPPVYVRDLDEKDELIQWKLPELTEAQISVNRRVMGEEAVSLPAALVKQGLSVRAALFCDWRGSLDRVSRDPLKKEYGRQGAYSASLYIPKEIIQKHVLDSLLEKGPVRKDCFFPIMDTPALSLLPGGRLIRRIMRRILERCGLQERTVPFLALEFLHYIGRLLLRPDFQPFPRFDAQDSPCDPVFFHVLENLSPDSGSPFYFKKWIG